MAAQARASAGESAFVADMANLGIVAHHGHIADNAVEGRSVLKAGYGICDGLHHGHSVAAERHNLIVNAQTRTAMGQTGQLSLDQIDGMLNSARRDLCPDTL